MIGSGSRPIALVLASLASGPVYLTAYAAGSVVDAIPHPIVIAVRDLVEFLLSLLPALIGGFFITLIPLGFAILMMSAFASGCRALRAPLAWTLAGGAAAGLIVWVAEITGFAQSFAIVFTGMVSLRLARAYVAWQDPQALGSPGFSH